MSVKLWTEHYRPNTLDEYVWRDPEMRAIVEQWIEDGALPHCLFSGSSGLGKTSLAKLLFKTLNIPSADVLYINASRERQIDAFQNRIVNYVDSWALGPSGIKYVLLDECLHEDESIRMEGGELVQLKNLPDREVFRVQSLNMETGCVEADNAIVISRREVEVFEVELEDGRTVRASLDHPFLVEDQLGNIKTRYLRDLREGDHVLTIDDITSDI